jgi:hypothetical protein
LLSQNICRTVFRDEPINPCKRVQVHSDMQPNDPSSPTGAEKSVKTFENRPSYV